MINLLPTDSKQVIRYGRRNVVLARYTAFLLSGLLASILIFGVGYLISITERAALAEQLEPQEQEAAKYVTYEQQATKFRTDLKIAETLLGSDVVYSKLLLAISASIPDDYVLDSLSLNDTSMTADTTFTFRTNNPPENAPDLKDDLEKSDAFENVRIMRAGSSAANPKYKTEITIAARLSKQPVQAAGLGT